MALTTQRFSFQFQLAKVNATAEDVDYYRELRVNLRAIDLLCAALLFTNVMCGTVDHCQAVINGFVDDITSSCIYASNVVIPSTTGHCKCMLGWTG